MMSGHVFNAFEEKGSRTDPDGRIFYLWEDQKTREVFDTLGFKVCDFLNPDPRSLPAQLNFSEKRSRANLTGEPLLAPLNFSEKRSVANLTVGPGYVWWGYVL